MVELTDAECEEVIAAIRAGRPLPSRYRASLFEDASETELIWPGKTSDVERIVLPFQSIEHIDEPRSDTVHQPDLFSMSTASGRQAGGWTNKLIWGDNKLILSSLANGPMRQTIEDAGGLKLVYIDPPFDVGADFSLEVEVGGEGVTKDASVVEQLAYRDTWGRGRDSFAAMMHERLTVLFGLMANDSSLWLHCDHRVVAILRLICEEIFGADNFLNQVTWRRQIVRGMKGYARFMPFSADYILVFGKGNPPWQPIQKRTTISIAEAEAKYMKDEGGYFRTSDPGSYSEESLIRLFKEGRVYVTNGGEASVKDGRLEVSKGKVHIKYYRERVGDRVIEETVGDNIWDDIPGMGVVSHEYLGYPTQKPEALLRRILESCTEPGDLVADFFCGSGTSLAVAEKLGRKWIGVDLGRFAVHTTRKRMISVQRDRAAQNEPYRAFEILNLGSYERQYFAGVDQTLPEAERRQASDARQEAFFDLVLSAYGGQRSTSMPGFQGVKDSAFVLIGPLDAPVTQDDVRKAITVAKRNNITRVDILGFEFEMGIKPAMADEAKEEGLTLTLRYIPNDVFDKRAIAKGQVKFYDVGYLEVAAKQDAKTKKVTVSISDFGVFYAQDDADVAAASLKNGASKVLIDGGQVVRISKDKKGQISKDVLTQSWKDWIDYWAVDFDFESQKEIIAMEVDGEVRDVWTGRYIFENQWQDFRSKGSRDLSTSSEDHSYDTPGEYKAAVKVVDIFGNDTTKVVTVKVK